MERAFPLPNQQSNFKSAVLEKTEDPVSFELMTRAVTIVPCGHTFNEDTVIQCLANNKLCPLDRIPIERYVPNYTVRHLAETAGSPPQEEDSYSSEAEAHFLRGKKASEEGDIEGAIKDLLEALRLSPSYEKAQAYLEFCLQKTSTSLNTSLCPPQNRNNRKEKETKMSSDKEAYIDLLLHLFEEPAIKINSSLSQLLEREVEQLMDQESLELSEKSIERYKWTKKLLIDQKVSSFVVKKLQQLSLSSPPSSSPFQQMSFQPSRPPQMEATSSLRPVQNTRSSFTLPGMAFGKAKWAKYFGDVGVEPPLPRDIEGILNAQCIFWSNKKVKDTHLLVLVPQTVNGKPFHLNSLSKLIKRSLSGNKTEYRNYSKYVKNDLGNQSSPSHWALMTKDVIPKSRNKAYKKQKRLVASHAQKSGIPYELPKALDATTAILMHYVETGEHLYTDDKTGSQWTYTRCQEKVNNHKWPTAIGGFAAGGLGVDCDGDFVDDVSGAGAFRKFFLLIPLSR